MADRLIPAERLLGFVDQLFGLVSNARRFLARFILRLVAARVLHGAADFILAHVRGGGNRDFLLVARAQILCGDGHDAVCVNGERHLDLRHTRHRAADSLEPEIAQQLVVPRVIPLALQNLDVHSGLKRRGGGENLAVAGRDGRVSVDNLGCDAADRLDGQRQRRDVHQNHALRRGGDRHAAAGGQLAALQSRAHRDAFIRVDVARRGFPRELFDHLLHGGHARAAADEQHLPQLAHAQRRIRHHLTDRAAGALHQIARHPLELRAGDGHIEVMRAVCVLRQKRQRDLRAHLAAQFALGLFRRLANAEHRRLVPLQIYLFRALKLVGQIIRQPLVEVVAAEVVVAAGRQHLDHAVADLDERNVKCAAAEVVNQNLLRLSVVEAVGERRRRRLVDDAQHVQPRDAPRVARSLTLAVREIRRNGDDRLTDRLAEERLRVAAQLLQNHRGNFLRRIGLSVDLHAVIRAHFPLDGEHRPRRVDRLLPSGRLADHALPLLGKADDGGRRAPALGIGDDLRLAPFQHRHAAIRRAQINADNLAHKNRLQNRIFSSDSLFQTAPLDFRRVIYYCKEQDS